MKTGTLGALMARESAEAMTVFRRALSRPVTDLPDLNGVRAIYTVARGSSDAAANILSYEFMRELGIPVTSLPPSVFSLGPGVDLSGSAMLVISQSGASDDLVRCAQGASGQGARVVAITNRTGSPVEAAADATIPIDAGEERAVPATKTVIGSIGAGMALLATIKDSYGQTCEAVGRKLSGRQSAGHPHVDTLRAALLRARHVYVVGRDSGLGCAQEVALKIKECCALQAEAYSASEVLHGPLQLATNPLLVLLLDTGQASTQASLDGAEARFRAIGCDVHRVRSSDTGIADLPPAAAAALLLDLLYPVILSTALALGLDPDQPKTLSKVTQTV